MVEAAVFGHRFIIVSEGSRGPSVGASEDSVAGREGLLLPPTRVGEDLEARGIGVGQYVSQAIESPVSVGVGAVSDFSFHAGGVAIDQAAVPLRFAGEVSWRQRRKRSFQGMAW